MLLTRPLALVEYVGAGDRMIVRLKASPSQHYQVPVVLAGIRAPRSQRKSADGVIVPGEPFAEEAQDFVNSRMLQRDCSVLLYGLSDQKQLVGTVNHPNGNIATFLLKEGLARCFDAHTTLMGQDMSALRQAEQTARTKQLGVFKGAAAPKAGGRETDVVVSRVLNADTVFLRYPDGKEKRVGLSSVRQPRPSDPKQAPFGAEAKEFMRRRLIGKHVKVSANGKREANEGFEERDLVTVTLNNQNMALPLVEAGYASVIRHRMDDTDRSPDYDALRLAEDAAQKEEKGMWSSKPPETKQPINYSENLEKAKRLLSLLQRQKRVPAIVDFVMGGSRFALLIPRENARITFVLSGVQVPRSARNENETSELFGQEAHELATKRLQQRDVEIDVEENDKNGGFIGKLYVNRENFSRILLEDGFGTIRTRSAEKSGNLLELQSAEDKAKEARRGVWKDYDPSTETNGTAEEDTTPTPAVNGASASNSSSIQQAPPSSDFRDIYITHVDPDTCRIRFQTVGRSTTDALETLTSQLRSFHLSSPAPALTGPPKTGDTVLARFTVDNDWYRARVRRVDRDAKTAEILYADYGNSESLPWDELRQLPQAERFGAQALKFQAQEASFSFVQFPTNNKDYMGDAAAWLSRRTGDGKFVARVDFTDQRDGTLHLSVFDPDVEDAEDNGGGASAPPYAFINKELVVESLAMVGRKLQRWERAQAPTLKMLQEKESAAREEHVGMWEYGDITETD